MIEHAGMLWARRGKQVDLNHRRGCHQVIELGLARIPAGLRSGEHPTPERGILHLSRRSLDVLPVEVHDQPRVGLDVGQPVSLARSAGDDEASNDTKPPHLDAMRLAAVPAEGRDGDGLMRGQRTQISHDVSVSRRGPFQRTGRSPAAPPNACSDRDTTANRTGDRPEGGTPRRPTRAGGLV